MSDDTRPNLQLYWTMDCVQQKLYIQIAPGLTYESLEGGTKGYTKTFNGNTTHIEPSDWDTEKFWISEHYGEQYGYFRFHPDLITKHPEMGWDQGCPNGLGKEGEYLDHMARSQFVLEGHDCSTIGFGTTGNLYSTPDNGKTIFVRKATRNVLYPAELMVDENATWPDHPQACMMQPKSRSYQLSSYTEMETDGIAPDRVERCRTGQWDSPRRPELQRYYIYPTG